MKKSTRKNSTPLPPFQCGQVWQMIDSSLSIGLVGKRLVHYKHYNLKIKRPNVLLSNKIVLERFLQLNDAILLPEAPSTPTAAPKRIPTRRKSSL